MSEDRVVLGGLDRAESRLRTVRHLVLAACGTSLYASMYGAKLMRDLEAFDTATVSDLDYSGKCSVESVKYIVYSIVLGGSFIVYSV